MGPVRTKIGRFVVALLASISGIVVVGVLNVTPAFAGNNCGWTTQMGMQDATGTCRSGFVFDPGFGQLMTRQELVSNAALYTTSDGFSNNFLWYAPQTTLTLSPTQNNTLQWSECDVSGTEYLDSGNGPTACPSPSDVVPPPASHTIDDWDFNDATVTLDTWTWGQSSIFLVCGNPIYPAPPSSPVPTIIGAKFDDLNGNGVQDPGEPGIPNWPLTLTRVTSDFGDQPTGVVVGTTTTDSNGNFSFALNDDGPGEYAVTEGSEPGWTNTTGGTTEYVTVNAGIGNATISVPPFGNQPSKMTTLKEKASAKIVASGTAVTFTYLEKNIGKDQISGVTVSGSLCGPATFESSSDGNTSTLDPGATWKFECTAVLTNPGGEVNEVETDSATASDMDAVFNAPLAMEYASVRVIVQPSCLSLSLSPSPLVETGASEVHAIVQVEACAGFGNDTVHINSSQLQASCGGTITFENLQNGSTVTAPNVGTDSINAVLDSDGNATVVVDGTSCAPGSSLVEADLSTAPYLTASTRLKVLPPIVTSPGVTAFPSAEVETGNTTASGDSDVYAVFYVETDPVYAEQKVEISVTQLQDSCLGGWRWEPGNGGLPVVSPSTNLPATTIDNDGNAVFVFEGTSCAAGSSVVIADILAGTNPTYSTSFTVAAPAVTAGTMARRVTTAQGRGRAGGVISSDDRHPVRTHWSRRGRSGLPARKRSESPAGIRYCLHYRWGGCPPLRCWS